MVEAEKHRQIYTQNSAVAGENNNATPTVELESPLIQLGAQNARATNSSVECQSYEERKIQLAKSGQLIPALKASA